MPVLAGLFRGAEGFKPDPAVLALHLALSFPKPLLVQGFPLAQAGALLVQPRLWLLMFLVFLYVGTEFSVWSWTVTFLTTERGYEQTVASRMIAAFALAMMAGRWASQWTLVGCEPMLVLMVSAVGSVSAWLGCLRCASAFWSQFPRWRRDGSWPLYFLLRWDWREDTFHRWWELRSVL
jgi:predicted MFS family arabinose efflux permease